MADVEAIVEPISWQAIQLVKERLQAIKEADGFSTDLALGTISDNPAEKARTGAEIFTLISAGPFTDKPEASGRRTKVSDMAVEIEVTVPFDHPDNPALVAHRARADVVRALSGGIADAAAGIRSLEITGSSFVIDITADGAAVVVAQITARAGLAESTQPAT